MEQPTGIEDVTQKKKDERRDLVKALIDKKNPEMITFALSSEVDEISTLKTIGKDFDQHREKLGLSEGFLSKYIRNNLVIRTSIQGKRSVQIVDTIHGVMREEVLAQNPLSDVTRRLIGTK